MEPADLTRLPEAMWAVTLELAPWLLLGLAAASAMHMLLPPHFVRSHLQGRWAVSKAVALGVPMPLCSCGVIPAGLALRKQGASRGATLGFLISTPQTGIDSILVSGSMLGWPFAAFKLLSAALMGLAGGTLTQAWGEQDSKGEQQDSQTQVVEDDRSLRGGLRHGLEILDSIWHWVAVGVLVSAAITVFVPDNFFASTGALSTAGTYLAVLLVSVPLYVCATASVPIAAALVHSGLPMGAALVFLVAGPATNIATIGAIRSGLGGRALIIYLSTIVFGSSALGWAFDFVLAATPATAAPLAMQHHGAIAQLSALVLLALLGVLAVRDLGRALRKMAARRGTGGDEVIVRTAVEGMSCGKCVEKLSAALLRVDGVTAAEVSLEAGDAVVRGDANAHSVLEAIRAAGFRPRQGA